MLLQFIILFYLVVLQVLAFRDISPQAPVHILIIPKVRDGLTGLSKVCMSIHSFLICDENLIEDLLIKKFYYSRIEDLSACLFSQITSVV